MTDSNIVRGNLRDTTTPRPARTHGPYRLVRLLGQGSIAEVFEAIDPLSNRSVAIKLFRSEVSQRPPLSARLRAHAAGPPRLEHANINPLLSMICDGDEIGIVYPLVSGCGLDKEVQRAGPAKLSRVPEFVKILEAFEFAHSRRCFHLDIKPGNLVFPPDAPAQVLDFCMSRLLGISLLTAPFLGSLEYMSPEQLAGGEMDGRTDIFSLGAALYHLTTGELPFTGADRRAPKRPGLVLPSMPNRLEEVILKALASAPEERFQTAAEFRLALSKCTLNASTASPLLAPKAIPAPAPRAALRTAHPPPAESSSFLGWVALAIAVAAGSAATWTASREYSMKAYPSDSLVQQPPKPTPLEVTTPNPALPKPVIHELPAAVKQKRVFIRPRTHFTPKGPIEIAAIPLPSSMEPPNLPQEPPSIPLKVAAIPPPPQREDLLAQQSIKAQPRPGPSTPVWITSTAQEARRLSGRAPIYPTLARDQGITGTVRARITVSPEGKVSAVVPLSGHAFLKRAAVEAIKTWTYSPTIVEGRAVPVAADVNVVFNGPGKPH